MSTNFEKTDIEKTDIVFRKSAFLWVLVITGLILSIPLIAMQFTNEVNWVLTDFIVMGMLLFSMGSLFVSVSRKFHKKYRIVIFILCSITLFYIWAELAIGIFS